MQLVMVMFLAILLSGLVGGCTPKTTSACTDQFWLDLERVESGNNPLTMYREDGIKNEFGLRERDRVTGQPYIISEGPYQLSYADKLVYGADCDFEFEKDRAKFLADMVGHTDPASPRGFKSRNPRAIHEHARQRRCAETIVATLGVSRLGRYWSAVRDGKVSPCR